MFDNVGKNLDQEVRKRQFWSLLLTLLMFGIIGGGTAIYTFVMVVKAVTKEVQDTDNMVEVVMNDPAMDEAPPPPPPPPPPPASSAQNDDDVKPDPETMQDDVKPLDTKVEPVKDQASDGGQQGGVDGGVAGGVVGGVIGGVVGGVVGGQLGSEIKSVHHSEVTVKRQVMPDYPEAAKAMNLGDQDCKIRIFIDTDGVPYDIKFEACAKVFQDATREGAMKWRFYPYKDSNGQKQKVQFMLTVKYQLR